MKLEGRYQFKDTFDYVFYEITNKQFRRWIKIFIEFQFQQLQ